MNRIRILLCPLLFLFVAKALHANSITYAQTGSVAAQTPLYAETSGGLDLFYAGSTAGYTDYVGLYDLATGFDSGLLFDNKTTALGQRITVGAGAGQINAGDPLLVYIDSPEGVFSSLPQYSADGINHAYATDYAAGTLNGVSIPPGLFLGMEDEARGHSDLNYNDEDFVVTNVSTSVTPEPSSLLLLGTGLVGMILLLIRRRAPRGVL